MAKTNYTTFQYNQPGTFQPLTQEATFWDEVEASWDLSWAGQAYLEMTDEKTFLDMPEDPTLDVMGEIQNTHYMNYESAFDDVRNREHLEAIKDKIDFNNYQRKIRDDAGIMPELVAALGDPLTYVPIPFVKGVTMMSRFVKGGAAVGTLVALSEPVRQSLDPTSTMSESISYIGAAFVMGGGFSAAFGRRLSPKFSNNSPEQKVHEDYFKAVWDTENDNFISPMYDAESGVKYQVEIKDLSYGYKLDTGAVKQKDAIGNTKYVHIKRASDARSGVKENTIVIDEARIHKDFMNDKYRLSNQVGVTNLPKFNNVEDFKKFLIDKEATKFIDGQPKAKNAIEAENLLNREILENANISNIKRNIGAFGKERNIWAERVDRWVTDFGELTNNKFKNTELGNRIADKAVALFGDAGVVTRGAKFGQKVTHSALTRATLNHFQAVGSFNTALHNAWKAHRNIAADGQRSILGYDPVAQAQKGRDIVAGLVDKVQRAGGRPGLEARTTFTEFKEIVGRAMGDEEFRLQQSEAVQKFAADARTMYDEIGKQAKDLGMFQSQQVIVRNKAKFQQRYADIENIINEIRPEPKNLKLIEELEILQQKADDEIGSLNKLERELEIGIAEEFDPLVENYVNRVFDVENVLKDITANDVNFIAPKTIKNKIQIKKGMTPGMVVEFRHYKEEIVETVKGPVKDVEFQRDAYFGTIQKINDDGSIEVSYTIRGVDGNMSKVDTRTLKEGDYTLRHNKIKKEDKRFYSIPDENSLRGKIFKHFVANPRIYKFKDINGNLIQVPESNSTYNINVKVQEALDDIIDDTQGINMENDLGITKSNKGILTGATNLMSRKLNMTDKELEGFLVRDINYLFRQYSDRMYKRIEVTKRFGDSQMKTDLWDTELDMLLNEGVGNLAYIKETMQTLRNSRDKVYNIYNTGDPSSFFKSRLPHALRNWASLAMMGKVYLSSLVDIGRMPMVHGLSDTMKVLNAKNPFSAYSDELNKALEANKWLADAFDVVMNDTSIQRLISQQERVGSGTTIFGRYFDKLIGKPLDRLQSPFYHANLLSPHTQLVKQWTGHISTHRFLEDSIKVAKGTASESDIARLASYGISKAEARAIAKLPIEKTKNGLHYLPEEAALKTKNGAELGRKLRYATFNDVQRTIITPSIADKPNMMFGVIRIKNENLAKALDNDVMKFFGFEKTEAGGKINNGFLALPLQFFAWSFASNRKLMLSAAGGRETSIMGGIAAMYCFAYMGDYLKNPTYHQHKTTQEKIYRSLEMSGVLGLPADINFMVEVVSEGMFNTPMGVRPMIGTPGRFGEANAADATGEFIGAGPGMLADLIYAFREDLPFDEKAATIRRLIPLNNLLWFNNSFINFKDTYNTIAREYFR